MSAAQLARIESMRPQSMGTLLSALEKNGLIEREAHPSDRRQIIFSLTPTGAALHRQRRAARQEWLIKAISAWKSEDQQMLIGTVALLKQLGETE